MSGGGWVTMRHGETRGETQVPDSEDVIAAHEARGWERVSADELAEREQQVFVPQPAVEPDAPAWVELVHPDLPLGRQTLPNHPDALQAAFDKGWTYPEPDPGAVEEIAQEIREAEGKRRGKPTRAEQAEAERIAAEQAAGTDEPPAVIAGEDQQTSDAGDGTQNER